mgnify:CR=1 FL=1
MSDKLNIANEMSVFDRKDRTFYDSLTDEERKKFATFLMIRWGSMIEGSQDLQAYYLMSTNERLNKHFFDISASRHKKLQWLLATTVSPGMGRQYHTWITPKKKTGSDNKVVKFLRELYPLAKEDEIRLLSELNTKEQLREYAKQLGWDDKRIKDTL